MGTIIRCIPETIGVYLGPGCSTIISPYPNPGTAAYRGIQLAVILGHAIRSIVAGIPEAIGIYLCPGRAIIFPYLGTCDSVIRPNIKLTVKHGHAIHTIITWIPGWCFIAPGRAVIIPYLSTFVAPDSHIYAAVVCDHLVGGIIICIPKTAGVDLGP